MRVPYKSTKSRFTGGRRESEVQIHKDIDVFTKPLPYDSIPELRDGFFRNIRAGFDSGDSSLFGKCIYGLSQLILDTDNFANQLVFDEEFASFLMNSASVFPDEADAVLRLVYTLSRSNTDARAFFFRSNVMDLAFSTLETDDPELFTTTLDIIALFLQFYREDAALPLPVPSLLETLLDMQLHDATMAKSAVALILSIVKYRDFEPYLVLVFRLLFDLCDSFASDKVLSLTVECMFMLLNCNVDFIKLMYNYKLISLFSRRLRADIRSPGLHPYHSQYLRFLDRALYVAKHDFMYRMVEKMRFQVLLHFIFVDDDEVPTLAMSVIDFLLEIEERGTKLMGVVPIFELLINEKTPWKLLRGFGKCSAKRKCRIARLLHQMLKMNPTSLYPLLVTGNYIQKIVRLADLLSDSQSLYMVLDSMGSMINQAVKCGEWEGVLRPLLVSEGILDFIDPLRTDENPEIQLYACDLFTAFEDTQEE
jgi:hypothetical protein